MAEGKTIFKGTLSFGLVSIQIELYSAIKQHAVGFKLLHAKCDTPLQYQRYCPHCKKVVLWNDVVKAIKLPDDTYFVLTPENLRKLKPERTELIDIVEFVEVDKLDPIYYESHYYVLPHKVSDKAYYLFAQALAQTNKVAIATFVMRDKDYVCAIAPYENGLLLSTLHFETEVRQLAKFDELTVPAFDKQELALAQQLINKLSKKKFDISRFKDRFIERLKAKIKASKKRIKIPQKAKAKKETSQKKPSLLQALKASLSNKEARA